MKLYTFLGVVREARAILRDAPCRRRNFCWAEPNKSSPLRPRRRAIVPRSRAALESCGKKSVGAVPVRPQAKLGACLQRNTLRRKELVARQRDELGMRGRETFRNRLVL